MRLINPGSLRCCLNVSSSARFTLKPGPGARQGVLIPTCLGPGNRMLFGCFASLDFRIRSILNAIFIEFRAHGKRFSTISRRFSRMCDMRPQHSQGETTAVERRHFNRSETIAVEQRHFNRSEAVPIKRRHLHSPPVQPRGG